jgi:hypothetical protein
VWLSLTIRHVTYLWQSRINKAKSKGSKKKKKKKKKKNSRIKRKKVGRRIAH